MTEIITADENNNESINNLFNLIFNKFNISEKLINEFNKLDKKSIFIKLINFNGCHYNKSVFINYVTNLVWEIYNNDNSNLIINNNNESYSLYGIIIRIVYFNFNRLDTKNEKLQYYLENIKSYDNAIIPFLNRFNGYEDINYNIFEIFTNNFNLIFNNRILLFAFINIIDNSLLYLSEIMPILDLLFEKGLKSNVFKWCDYVNTLLISKHINNDHISIITENKELIDFFDLKNIITNKLNKLHPDEELFSLLNL